MGPNNIALVRLFQADQALRVAQERLDAATKDVRIQERRANDLHKRLAEAQKALKGAQVRAGNSELDLKTRDAHIEKLRNQQQNTRNNKEYQAVLLEISTHKADRNKVEDLTMKALEEVERTQGQIKELSAQAEVESTKLTQLKSQINEKAVQLQAEIDTLIPARAEAAEGVSPLARQSFDRLADRLDGEAMAALSRPNPKHEEYVCTACNLDVVTDVYNRLHSRDDLVYCPSCGRILFIPEDLTPDQAVNQKKEVKVRKPRAKKTAASIGRQSSAVDVLNSMKPEEEETTETNDSESSNVEAAPAENADTAPAENVDSSSVENVETAPAEETTSANPA